MVQEDAGNILEVELVTPRVHDLKVVLRVLAVRHRLARVCRLRPHLLLRFDVIERAQFAFVRGGGPQAEHADGERIRKVELCDEKAVENPERDREAY